MRAASTQPPTQPPPGSRRPTAPPPQLGPEDLGAAGIAYRAQTIASEDLFAMLGVADGAPVEAVRAAYFRLAKLWHPDRLPPELSAFQSEVTQIFGHLTRAHQTLCDPEARKRWLETRAGRAPGRARADVLREIDHALVKRDFATVEHEAKILAAGDPEDAEALALAAWATARAAEAPEEELRAALTTLDRAVHIDRTCERALLYRGWVAKRLGKTDAAFRDFARVLHLNPKHIDAQREVRLMEMRARKGSGEHGLGNLISKVTGKKP